MSKIEKDMIDAAKQALAVIDNLADAGIAIAGATGIAPVPALVLISKITKVVAAGFERNIKPQEVVAHIEQAAADMRAQIAADDAAADDRLKKRYRDGGKLKPEPGAVVPLEETTEKP